MSRVMGSYPKTRYGVRPYEAGSFSFAERPLGAERSEGWRERAESGKEDLRRAGKIVSLAR